MGLDPDIEFRLFVSQGRLTAVSQYMHLVYFPRLNRPSVKAWLASRLASFFENTVKPRLEGLFKRNQYVVDVALQVPPHWEKLFDNQAGDTGAAEGTGGAGSTDGGGDGGASGTSCFGNTGSFGMASSADHTGGDGVGAGRAWMIEVNPFYETIDAFVDF